MTDKKKEKTKVDWKIVCLGLLCITVLELYALSLGINGVLLTTIIGILAVAIGVSIPSPFKR